jgi:hypothetical protein
MENDYLVYCLVNDSYIFDDNPDLISIPKVVKPEFDQKLFSYGKGRLATIWPKNITFYINGNQPVDLLLCTPHIEIVSDRAKNVIEGISQDDIEFLPVNIQYISGEPYKKMRYWAINVLTIIDALDWENSKWTKTPTPNMNDPMAYMALTVPSMNTNKIINHKFFRIIIGEKIIGRKYLSLVMKKELEKSGFTIGMQFTPIKTT